MLREASRRSTQRAYFYSLMGKHNIIINSEILILAMWFTEQKIIFLRCRTDIRNETARPWRSLTTYFSDMLKETNLKLSHNIVTGLNFVVLSSHKEFFKNSEVIAFFCEDGFFVIFTYIFA